MNLKAGLVAAALILPLRTISAQSDTSCPKYQDRKYELKKSTDDFEKYTATRSQDIDLSDDQLKMELLKVESRTPTYYMINVRYIGNEWMFIEKGESLAMLTNGVVTRFSTKTDPSRDVWESGRVYESVMFAVT